MNIIQKILKNLSQPLKTKMEAEIYEQSDIIFELIKRYINKDYSVNIELPDNIKKIALIASGSSYHSAAIIADFLRNKVHISAQSYYSSEIALEESFDTDEETLYIFISQSGETSDTNISMNKIKETTDKTLVITNVKNSSLYNKSKYKLLTYAGNEQAVSATKTMCAQMFCLFLVALKIMTNKELPSIKYTDELLNVPEYIKNALSNRDIVKKYAKTLVNYDNATILASGLFYPLAKEGALKIKETSYINTTAYPTGEFLHGHIAILNKKCALIVLVNSQNIQFTIDVLMKINNFYKTDTLIILSALPIQEIDRKDFIQIETKSEIDFLFSSLVILQLLAFETAVLLKRNIDKPEGLSKVVK